MPLDMLTPPTAAQLLDEAEQYILAAVLQKNAAFDMAAKHITGYEMFSVPVHRRIWNAYKKLLAEGRTITPPVLMRLFNGDQDLQNVGGATYIADLAAMFTHMAEVEENAQLVRDAWTRREIVRIAQEVIARAQNVDPLKPNESAEQILDALNSSVGQVIDAANGEKTSRKFSDYADAALAEIADMQKGVFRGLRTGLHDLDKCFNRGLRQGGLYLIAGRPGMGKTAVSGQIALNMAQAGKWVRFASLEMPGEDIAHRFLCNLSGVPNDRADDPDAQAWEALIAARNKLADMRILLDDQPGQSLSRIATQARADKRRGQLDCLIVDYAGLIGAETEERQLKRWERFTEVSGNAKKLARLLNIPVIMLSQLNREVENREDKRPTIADLRDAGAWEQDADGIILLYREEYYLRNPPEPRKGGLGGDEHRRQVGEWEAAKARAANRIEICAAKNRHGRTGVARSYCDLSRSLIRDLQMGEN